MVTVGNHEAKVLKNETKGDFDLKSCDLLSSSISKAGCLWWGFFLGGGGPLVVSRSDLKSNLITFGH